MKHSKSSIFLMEMILCILFFALSAAVCVQLFVKSHLISQSTINENHSVIIAENLAEAFYAYEGSCPQIASALYEDSARLASDQLTLFYDEDWELLSKDQTDQACFSVVLSSPSDLPAGTFADASICISKVSGSEVINETIYELTLRRYIPLSPETH